MNPLSAALESRIAAHAPALSVRLPSGRRLGATNARVRLAMKSWAPFAHLVTGQIGRLAEDHVQGRVDLTGSMRDIVEAAAALQWPRCLCRNAHSTVSCGRPSSSASLVGISSMPFDPT